MIPRTFPSIIEAFQTKMVVYVVPSITGLKAWIDYIPVKGVVTESATLANTYANGGYQVVKSLDSLTGLQAWIGYIPVYEDASYNKPWSTDAGGYIPVGGLFSIPSLFASGAPGVWYDPSDYSTLFQDSAGTTPVTAVEQPVGLMLDKSQGLVLGSERVGATWLGTDATWSQSGSTLIAVLGSNFSIYQTIVPANSFYRVTFEIFDYVAGTLNIRLGNSGAVLANFNANGTYTVTASASGDGSFYWMGNSTFTGKIRNISVKQLAGNHAFQATSASRPVLKIDGNGKLYLKFDGVDDSLSTNSISFTATDKMSVFAGVRKLSDAAAGVITELSSGFVSNAGCFYIFAGNQSAVGAAAYATGSRGTLLSSATTPTTFTAPVTNTLTGLYDISGDSSKLRANTVQVINDTADQGTGNYGNYPLFIGRRNNASIPFNGQMYSMIIVGKAVTAGELSSTETYVNQKTGAY